MHLLDHGSSVCTSAEGSAVSHGVLSIESRVTMDSSHDADAQGKQVKGRMLVIADGATSKLATQMGYCTEPPKGVCSRAFIEGGTHNVDFDGAQSLFNRHCSAPCRIIQCLLDKHVAGSLCTGLA